MTDLRRLDRERMEPAYGLLGQRLMPWPELNAPFEGAWCVLRAGTASDPHAHHEYEIFIAVSGTAVVVVDGRRHRFQAGDVLRLPPGSTHQVVNDGPDDFEYYGIWWDAAMTARFTARHQADAR